MNLAKPVFLTKKQREELKLKQADEEKRAHELLLEKEKKLIASSSSNNTGKVEVEKKRAEPEFELQEAELQAIKVCYILSFWCILLRLIF